MNAFSPSSSSSSLSSAIATTDATVVGPLRLAFVVAFLALSGVAQRGRSSPEAGVEIPGGNASIEVTLIFWRDPSDQRIPKELGVRSDCRGDKTSNAAAVAEAFDATFAASGGIDESLTGDNRKGGKARCCFLSEAEDLRGNYSVLCRSTPVDPQKMPTRSNSSPCDIIADALGLFRRLADESRIVCSRVRELVLRGLDIGLERISSDVFPLLNRVSFSDGPLDNLRQHKTRPAPLETLRVTDGGLTSLDGDVLTSCSKTLRHLDLSRNDIGMLANMTFVDMFQLRSVNLSNNLLEIVELNSFYSSPVEESSASSSSSSSPFPSDCQSASCASIDSTTESNREQADGYRALEGRAEVQSILINNSGHPTARTSDKPLGSSEFEGGWQLRVWTDFETLDLSGNLIAGLDPSFFSGSLRNLRHLYLSRNRLASLSRVLLRDLERLETLDVSRNSIVWMDGGFFVHRHLATIDLSGNSIRKILSMTFLYLPAIRVIDLSRNNITYVHRTAFYRLCKESGEHETRRRVLISLRENRLRLNSAWKISSTVVDSLQGNMTTGCLVHLDLGSNRISHLFGGGLEAVRPYDLGYLRGLWRRRLSLDAGDNSLSCDCTALSDVNLIVDLLSEKADGGENGQPDLEDQRIDHLETFLSLVCSRPSRYSGLTLAQFGESARLECDASDHQKTPGGSGFYCPEGCSCERRDNPTRGFASSSSSSSSSSHGYFSGVFHVNCSGRRLLSFPHPNHLPLVYSDVSLREKQVLVFSGSRDGSLEKLDGGGGDDDDGDSDELESNCGVEIDLSHNLLTRIDFKRLARLYPNANSLRLNDNNLPLVSESIFQMKNLRNLTLAGNPLRCTCVPTTILPLKELAVNGMLVDLNSVACFDGPSLEDFLRHDLKFCLGHFKTLRLVSGETRGYVENPSEISFPAAIICTLVLAFLLAIVVYLRVKRHGKRRSRVGSAKCKTMNGSGWSLRCLPLASTDANGAGSSDCRSSTGDDFDEEDERIKEGRLFCERDEPRLTKDVFVMYCEEEENWVTGCLLEILWSKFPRYRVCLQQHLEDDTDSSTTTTAANAVAAATNATTSATNATTITVSGTNSAAALGCTAVKSRVQCHHHHHHHQIVGGSVAEDSSEFSKLIPSSVFPVIGVGAASLQVNACLMQIRQSQLTMIILSESFMGTLWTNDHFRAGILRHLESQRHRFMFIFRQRWLDLEEKDRALYAAVCDYDCLVADDERLAQKLGELLPQPLPWPIHGRAGQAAPDSPPVGGGRVVFASMAAGKDVWNARPIVDKSGRYFKVVGLSEEKY